MIVTFLERSDFYSFFCTERLSTLFFFQNVKNPSGKIGFPFEFVGVQGGTASGLKLISVFYSVGMRQLLSILHKRQLQSEVQHIKNAGTESKKAIA